MQHALHRSSCVAPAEPAFVASFAALVAVLSQLPEAITSLHFYLCMPLLTVLCGLQHAVHDVYVALMDWFERQSRPPAQQQKSAPSIMCGRRSGVSSESGSTIVKSTFYGADAAGNLVNVLTRQGLTGCAWLSETLVLLCDRRTSIQHGVLLAFCVAALPHTGVFLSLIDALIAGCLDYMLSAPAAHGPQCDCTSVLPFWACVAACRTRMFGLLYKAASAASSVSFPPFAT